MRQALVRQRAERGQHGFTVAGGFYPAPGLREPALRIEQEDAAVHAQKTAAIEQFIFHGVQGFTAAFIRIGEQRKGQFFSGLEFFQLRRSVGTHAQHHGAQFLQFRKGVAKLARFLDSTRRIGAGKQKQHHRPAMKITQIHALAVLIEGAKPDLIAEVHGFILRLYRRPAGRQKTFPPPRRP